MTRIYHTWDKWECYPAGFYDTNDRNGRSKEECELLYMELLSDDDCFSSALSDVIYKWKNSCEHYLTNENMNRIAWLGQAALAYTYNIPSCYRGGYNKLSEEQQQNADNIALKYLNIWLDRNNHEPYSLESVKSKTQANMY